MKLCHVWGYTLSVINSQSGRDAWKKKNPGLPKQMDWEDTHTRTLSINCTLRFHTPMSMQTQHRILVTSSAWRTKPQWRGSTSRDALRQWGLLPWSLLPLSEPWPTQTHLWVELNFFARYISNLLVDGTCTCLTMNQFSVRLPPIHFGSGYTMYMQ